MNSQAFHSSILIWFTSSFRLWENSEKLKCEEQSVSNCSWYAASYLGLGQLLWDKTLFFLLFSSFLKKICPMQVVSCYLISRPSVFNCCNKTMFVRGATLSRAGHQVFEKGAPRIPIRDRPKQMWESIPKIPVCSAVSLQLQSDPVFCLKWDLFSVCEGDSENIHWVKV